MEENHRITSIMLGFMYPFILIFGFYIIFNGHITPGGGFQGGAILFAIFIGRYLSEPDCNINFNVFKLTEKILYIFIITIPTVYLLWQLNSVFPSFNKYYLILMNLLIGIKVCCGLSIIFFRFVFFESR